MKTTKLLITGLAFVFLTIGFNTPTDASWLSKGLDTLKQITKAADDSSINEPSLCEIGQAFKEALRIGTEEVVGQLGVVDGFNMDDSVHIPLPGTLQTVKSYLAKVGMTQPVDDLELKLNRAAEAATPKAKALFFNAISEMTFSDLKTIYDGPDDSATNYFQNKMSPQLIEEMRPIVANALSEVGAILAYDKIIGQYKSIPFVPDVKANLQDYVVQKGIEGIFFYVAQKEAEIRNDPTKQTTALLQKVFGSDG